MTLIEILVVVGILLMVAAVTLPRLRPAIDKSRVRESARSLQLYLSSAKSLAMSTGRSCGVMIEPLPGDAGAAMQVTQVETPVAYGGDTLGCTATLKLSGQPQTINGALIATCNVTLSSPASVTINAGDWFQVGYQGYWLNIIGGTQPPGATSFQANMDISHGETPGWLNQPVTGPYKLTRWPVKSAASALQLPSPAAIDLTWSGCDPVSGGNTSPIWWPGGTPSSTPLLIMFTADGHIDWVSNWGAPGGQQVASTIYLLVGRRDNVYDNANDPNIANTNLNTFNSQWVAINPATGLIVVADLGVLGTSASALTPSNNAAQPDSRYFARQASANGG